MKVCLALALSRHLTVCRFLDFPGKWEVVRGTSKLVSVFTSMMMIKVVGTYKGLRFYAERSVTLSQIWAWNLQSVGSFKRTGCVIYR